MKTQNWNVEVPGPDPGLDHHNLPPPWWDNDHKLHVLNKQIGLIQISQFNNQLRELLGKNIFLHFSQNNFEIDTNFVIWNFEFLRLFDGETEPFEQIFGLNERRIKAISKINFNKIFKKD